MVSRRLHGASTGTLFLFLLVLRYEWYCHVWLKNKRIINDHATWKLDDPGHDEVLKLVEISKESAWDKAINEAEKLLSMSAQKTADNPLPSCLVPDKQGTAAVVQRALAVKHKTIPASRAAYSNQTDSFSLVPLPVLNVGMPKCGSTTLFHFFNCIGFAATHWRLNTNDFEGLCMRDAVKVGLPPIATCASGKDALMQIDIEEPFGYERSDLGGKFRSNLHRDDCFFPQLSLLEEIHKEAPNATFILNFRPIEDWVRSIMGWTDMLVRFKHCHLPNLPRGLPELQNEAEVQHNMMRFFCSHILHLRHFVESHPSHALIELDLYDNNSTKSVLTALFPSSGGKEPHSQCWQHSNKSGKKRKYGTTR